MITPMGNAMLVCDHKCEKAFGVDGRRLSHENMRQLSAEEDDILYLPDDEVGVSNTVNEVFGGIKPTEHVKWCYRSCERSSAIEPLLGGRAKIRYQDFAKPVYNMPWKHGASNHYKDTGFELAPDGELYCRLILR